MSRPLTAKDWRIGQRLVEGYWVDLMLERTPSMAYERAEWPSVTGKISKYPELTNRAPM